MKSAKGAIPNDWIFSVPSLGFAFLELIRRAHTKIPPAILFITFLVPSLILRSSSVPKSVQSRWKVGEPSIFNRNFTEFGTEDHGRIRLATSKQNEYFWRIICNYAENNLILQSEKAVDFCLSDLCP